MFEKTPQNKVRPVILTGGICLCVAQMALMKVLVPDSFFNTDVDVCIQYSAHISVCSTALSPFDICCHCYFVNETLSHWLQYAEMETVNFSLFVKFIADEQDFRQDLLNSQVLAFIVFLQSGRHYQTFPSADFHPQSTRASCNHNLEPAIFWPHFHSFKIPWTFQPSLLSKWIAKMLCYI